jgi:hypothetical protein
MRYTILLLILLIRTIIHGQITGVITNTTSQTCRDGEIKLTINGGLEPYTYDWFGPNGFVSIDKDLIGLGVGQYDVTVYDALCGYAKASFTVGVDANKFYIADKINIPDCNNTTGSGFIGLQVPTTGKYTYKWSGQNGFKATTKDIYPYEAGSYYVIITNEFGCSVSLYEVLCC